jgi:hypothetical protein
LIDFVEGQGPFANILVVTLVSILPMNGGTWLEQMLTHLHPWLNLFLPKST